MSTDKFLICKTVSSWKHFSQRLIEDKSQKERGCVGRGYTCKAGTKTQWDT